MKILAIASAGGHWVQLLRLLPALEGGEVIFASTHGSFAETVKEHKFFVVPDANRWNKVRLLYSWFCLMRLVFSIKPDVVVTTGAAPGLMGIISGRFLGAKTIWIDSIANVEKVSLSGRIAIWFADRVYTQWPELATSRIQFRGSTIS